MFDVKVKRLRYTHQSLGTRRTISLESLNRSKAYACHFGKLALWPSACFTLLFDELCALWVLGFGGTHFSAPFSSQKDIDSPQEGYDTNATVTAVTELGLELTAERQTPLYRLLFWRQHLNYARASALLGMSALKPI